MKCLPWMAILALSLGSASLVLSSCGDPENRKTTQPREGSGEGDNTGNTGGGDNTGGSGGATTKSDKDFPGGNAVIKGRVVFDGDVPRPRKHEIAGDEFCVKCYAGGELPTKEIYEIDKESKGVAHAFVYIKGASGMWKFSAPTEAVVLDQVKCRYVPHMVGIMVGQPLKVRSSDETPHNVHWIGRKNRLTKANFQQNKGDEETLSFKRVETGGYFKCDIHGWMRSYVNIVDHTLHATTNAKGEFTLPKLPAGDYEVGVWHRKYKGAAVKVTVSDDKPADVTLKIK